MTNLINQIQLGRMLIVGLAIALTASGCASHSFVRKQDAATKAEVETLNRDVDRALGEVAELGEEVDGISRTAQEALERAIAAGELADGKFLYETVLTDDAVKFGFDQATLSGQAHSALDDFARQIRERNENVYIEIQGHTDNIGNPEYNLQLGQQRASTVRDYLSKNHGLALHRMNIISYGEASPAVDNATREDRAQNRRVALVVLQ